MSYFGIPGHTQSMIAYSISGISSEKLHCVNVVNMPYLCGSWICPYGVLIFLLEVVCSLGKGRQIQS